MKNSGLRIAAAGLILCGWVSVAKSQAPAYLDTNLPTEQRAADLVRRMTLEEKISQLVNQARAIPRLNVPAYDFQNESLHGVMVDGTTEFPEPIGLAATFDAPAIHQMAAAIGTEGRIKHARAVRAGDSSLFQGLDFWAPNINIFRDPRWGRGQETYGEDPFLTSRLAVAFVTGMQGDDPTAYHFEVHRTGYHSNDAYTAYLEMGAPKDLTATQLAYLNELTRDLPQKNQTVRSGRDGSAKFTIPMNSNDIVLAMLRPVAQ